jgi:tetratricopeptide (TPR) repeat protein
LGFVLQDQGDFAGALNTMKKARPIAEVLAAKSPDPKFRDWLAGVYWKMGGIEDESGDFPAATESFRQSAAIREPVVAAVPGNSLFRTHLAGDYLGLGESLGGTGNLSEAARHLEDGCRLLEQLVKSNSANATLKEYLGEGYGKFVVVLRKQQRFDEALRYTRQAEVIFAQLLSRDPANALASGNTAAAELDAAEILLIQGRVRESLKYTHKTLAVLDSMRHDDRYEVSVRAAAYATKAGAYALLARSEPSLRGKRQALLTARTWYLKSLDTWREYQRLVPPNNPRDRTRNTEQRLRECQAALAALDD